MTLDDLLDELGLDNPLDKADTAVGDETALASELGGTAALRRVAKPGTSCPFVTGVTYVTEGDEPVRDGVED